MNCFGRLLSGLFKFDFGSEKKSVYKVMLDEGAYMPTRAHKTDAGADLYARERVVVPANGSATFDTGVHIQIAEGFFGKLESKSGLNMKASVVSHGGVIDCGYTGSIVAKLYNESDKDYEFKPGEKIVQIIIQPCELVGFELVESLEETDRGDNGFGSSGK